MSELVNAINGLREEFTNPRVNVPLLRKTLEVVEQEAAKMDAGETCQWDQGEWRCGTGMCFAGWAVHLDGGKWATEELFSDHFDDLVAEPEDRAPMTPWDHVDFGVKAVTQVGERAQRILGLTNEEQQSLFAGINGIEDIRRVTSKILRRAEQQPA